jgi:hypothetical protein
MRARREFRNRDDTEVAVLDALVDRNEDGMTVFELRAHVDAGIDDLEEALGNLKTDDLIAAEKKENRTVITVDERVVPDGQPEPPETILDRIREKLRI